MEVPPAKALAIAVAAKLSRRQYIRMQKHMSEELNFPRYELLAQEKVKCYPAAEDLTITETSAKIKLQALMDLTSRRLVSAIDTSCVDANEQFILTSQWGIDRSSSHSVCHNERFQAGDYSELVFNFMICVVPLSLESKGVTIWKNEQPSSLTFCRPILFKFMNDTKENVQAELATIKAEIVALTPTTLAHGINVAHQMTLTMIDDEYLPINEETVGSVCQICKANAIKTNPHLQFVKRKQANKDMHNHGLSSLHAWIRSMDSLLEISYKLENKAWHQKSKKAKFNVMCQKLDILLGLRRKGLVREPWEQIRNCSVYKGRSAKQFFEDTDYFSGLTKIDFELFSRLSVILRCISSGRKIIVPKFREFCVDTAKRYMELYPWYHMPSPLHKLLIHGPDFVEKQAIIPIGMLCEDLTELMDDKFWMCKAKDNSEQFNSSPWNEKFFHNLLLSSDPVLASVQQKFKVENSSFKEFHQLIETTKHEYDDHSGLTDDSEDGCLVVVDGVENFIISIRRTLLIK